MSFRHFAVLGALAARFRRAARPGRPLLGARVEDHRPLQGMLVSLR